MNIFDSMRLRSEWEEIVSFRKAFDLPSYEGTIDNLYYFIEHAAKKNRFRKGFDEAMNIAKTIVEYYENEKTHLPSVSRKEVETV